MHRILQKLLTGPVLWLSNRFSSHPEKERVFAALSELFFAIINGDKKRGLLVPFDISTGKFIIFSDQHKGARNGADDFAICEPNYLDALDYYYQEGYHLIALGDCEELWENLTHSVLKHQKPSFASEAKFIPKNAFIKIFGNHDLFWSNDPFAPLMLKQAYGYEVPIYEAVVLETKMGDSTVHIFCTHGHQGDAVSDGNWFSKFFISRIWAPLQSYLKINPNTPAYDASLKTLHNNIMYQWSAEQKNMFLITGHTHQPLFESLTHLERLCRQLLFAQRMNDKDMTRELEKEIALRKFEYKNVAEDFLSLKPTYFNTGCCCFSDGEITGIEIEENCFRLIKWTRKDGTSHRMILEEAPMEELLQQEVKGK